MIHVRLDNGCIGFYEAGWSRSLAAENRKEFIGDKGRLTLTLQQNRTEDQEEGDLIRLYTNTDGEYRTINVHSKYKDMYAQLEHLIAMIERDVPANPTIDEVFSAYMAAVTAQRAIEQHAFLPV